MNLRMTCFAPSLFALFGLITSAFAADWPQFRGPGGSGRADANPLPAEIGPNKNVVWKTALPPGHSSPIVVGDRIYLTGVKDKKLVTIALERDTGKIVWEVEAPSKGLEEIHKIGSHAQATPVADSESVISFFGSSGLFCYDRDGKPKWQRPMGPFKNNFGAASSPILVNDCVILCQDHDEDSFLEAMDKRTGKTIWKTDRSEFLRGWCTPVLWQSGRQKYIVVAGTLRMIGYDLQTGKEAWTVRGMARTICTTPNVGEDGKLYVSAWTPGADEGERIAIPPFDEFIKQYDKNKNGTLEADEPPKGGPVEQRFPQFDTNKDGHITKEEYERFRGLFQKTQNAALVVRPGGTGDITSTHVEWRFDKYLPFCASPLQVAETVFLVKDGGFLTTLDGRNGKLVKRDRLGSGAGNYYASPVAGDGKVYLLSERGKLTVVGANKEWEELASADFKEDVYATPALVDGKIYLRTAGHLYCFGSLVKK